MLRESVFGFDKKLDETIDITINSEGKGENIFTIPESWKDYGDPCIVRKYYLEEKETGDEFPRSYYVANPNKTEEENRKNNRRIEALMLKVTDDVTLDEAQETNSAVILGEELLLEESNKEEKVCECEARIRAYMRMLRVGEGTEGEIGYTKLFGHDNFTEAPHNKDMSDHPQIKVYWYTKKDGTKVYSSAAGAYQVMGYTWDDTNMKIQRKVYGIKDFKSENQDLFCVIIFKHKRKGMLKLIVEGKIEEATRRYGSYEWASLPPGRHGQPNKTMAEALKLYEGFLEEELAEKSNLHLKKGFLKKFEISCKCDKKIKKGEICSNCKKEHIDLRGDNSKWYSQYDDNWNTWSDLVKDNACYDTCLHILDTFGLKKGSGIRGKNNSNVIQVLNEVNGVNTVNPTNAIASINYIDNQLKNGKPIIVGIDHKIGYTGNYENTTDHFVVIVGKGCEKGNVFYYFYEVGTSHPTKGTHDDNKLFLKEDNTLNGSPKYNTNKNYTISQVRKNV